MAIKTIQGCGGLFSAAGVQLKVQSWTMNAELATTDVTGLEDCNPVVVNTKATVTFSATGYLQYDAADTAPLDVTTATDIFNSANLETDFYGAFLLTATTGCTYAGNANMTSWDTTRTADGEAMIANCSFTVSGPVAQVWDETL